MIEFGLFLLFSTGVLVGFIAGILVWAKRENKNLDRGGGGGGGVGMI